MCKTKEMQLLLFLVSFSFVNVAFSLETCQDPCVCEFKDGFVVDLSTIGRLGKPRFYLILFGDLLYSYNPCHPFSFSSEDFEIDQLPCTNAAACNTKPGAKNGSLPTQHALAYQDHTVFFRESENTSVKINYTVSSHSDEKNLTVTLVCNETIQQELSITEEGSFTLTTWCACVNNEKCRSSPSHSKSGLSTGSVLLITFFVIILVYVGVGVLFNFCRGAHGTELLPNVEFWSELPKLIVEGFLFTCSCFRRRSSYADV